MSSSVQEHTNAVTYSLRLFADPANIVWLPAAFSFVAGTIALLTAASIPAIARIFRRRAEPSDWLFVVVAAGAFIPLAAHFFIADFDVTKPSYSSWVFGPLAVLFGVAANSETGHQFWDRKGRYLALSLALVGAFTGTVFFLTHANLFVHGPSRFLNSLYEQVPKRKTVVYEVGSAWGFSYFPLVFAHEGDIDQYQSSGAEQLTIRLAFDRRRRRKQNGQPSRS